MWMPVVKYCRKYAVESRRSKQGLMCYMFANPDQFRIARRGDGVAEADGYVYPNSTRSAVWDDGLPERAIAQHRSRCPTCGGEIRTAKYERCSYCRGEKRRPDDQVDPMKQHHTQVKRDYEIDKAHPKLWAARQLRILQHMMRVQNENK